MYKAIQEIGGYKIGEEVPTDKAEAWLKRYSIPPVELVSKEDQKKGRVEPAKSKNVFKKRLRN